MKHYGAFSDDVCVCAQCRAEDKEDEMRKREWIGVDYDGTLVATMDFKDIQDRRMGHPVWPMVYRVQQWLAQGRQVRIMTARVWEGANGELKDNAAQHRSIIEEFCWLHFNQKLRVTNQKDFDMVELWDDRAVQVEVNVGEPTVQWHSKFA